MTNKEVMQMALEALQENWRSDKGDLAIKALRTALAQPEPAECDGGQCGIGGYCKQCPKTQSEQEPVAWADRFDIDRDGHDFWVGRQKPAKNGVPLYIAPQREWVGLTDDEYESMAEQYVTNCYFDTLEYAKAIEAKLKAKNCIR